MLIVLLLLLSPVGLSAGTIDFEAFSDGTPLTSQIAGLAFSNATVIAAGISLNEFEFPPNSGNNVVFDDGGPLFITFLTPVFSFGAYFTYLTQLTLLAFDASNQQVGSAVSLFSNNLALSGDPGSSPNEFLSVNFGPGIYSVLTTGNPAGGSFTMDDASFAAATVPEPSSLLLALTTVGALWLRRLHQRQ